jgi:hypothetical protein
MSSLTLLEAFANLPDTRHEAGQCHKQSLCLALFTLAICVGVEGLSWLTDKTPENFSIYVRLSELRLDCMIPG